MVRMPPPGMASRALTARLSNDVSSWCGSAITLSRSEREAGFDGDLRPERALQQVAHAARQLDQVDRPQVELLPPREGQHALRQGGAALRALQGVVEQSGDARIVIGHVAAQQIEAAQHDGQQIVEVVRHAAGQLADRLDLLRVHQRLARAVEGELRLAALGDVARDLGEADQPARRLADGVDHDVGPEAGAVLALPPALGLEAAFALGDRQAARRLAAAAVLVGVEDREMLADDFVRPVALDALGAGVPVADDAAGVEHVDRVVGHALDQPAEQLLAASQLLLGLPSLGEVARDLGEAYELAVVVDGVDDDEGPEAAAVLAHAPAFGLELAVARGDLEHALRYARLAVGLFVEVGEAAGPGSRSPCSP